MRFARKCEYVPSAIVDIELGSNVRNLYKYVRIYSGALPIFDEGDIFRLTIP